MRVRKCSRQDIKASARAQRGESLVHSGNSKWFAFARSESVWEVVRQDTEEVPH